MEKMNNQDIQEIIKDCDYVLQIIQILNNIFPDIYYKYNGYSRDAVSFYYYGHCASFAKVLYNIFTNYATMMDNGSHVIVKIGNYFYDINGCINNLIDINEFRECPINYFPIIELMLTKPDNHDEEIKEELTKIGKNELKKIVYNHSNSKSR